LTENGICHVVSLFFKLCLSLAFNVFHQSNAHNMISTGKPVCGTGAQMAGVTDNELQYDRNSENNKMKLHFDEICFACNAQYCMPI
jgi:hypothetical protein